MRTYVFGVVNHDFDNGKDLIGSTFEDLIVTTPINFELNMSNFLDQAVPFEKKSRKKGLINTAHC